MTPEAARKQADDDFRLVLSTWQGRRFLWRLLHAAGLYAPSYADSPATTAYNEGRRSVALHWLAEAQRVAPESYALGLRELLAAQEAEAAEAQRKAEAGGEE